MNSKFKLLFSLILYKIKSLVNPRLCFSTNLINSRLDKTSAIRQNCRIYNSKIGRYTVVGRNTLMQNCKVGHFCSISEGCNIGLPSHPLNMVSSSSVFLCGHNYLRKNYYNFKWEACPRTFIGNDVWIGANAQIKSGLTIGNGSVIAAGAMVTHNIEPYSIVAGIPAKVLRKRFDDEKIEALQKTNWWDEDESFFKEYACYFANPDDLLSALKGAAR